MNIKLITCILMLFSLRLLAQKPPELGDHVLAGKPELIAKFTHYNQEKDSLTNSFTKMPVDTFINKINEFKVAANQLIAQDRDAKRRELKKGDLDYFIHNYRDLYTTFYGADRSPRKPGEKARLLIKMDSESRKKLTSQISDPDFNLNNAALYKVSVAYRIWLNNYITNQGSKNFPADPALGFWGHQVSKFNGVKAYINDPFIKEDQMYKATLIIYSAVKDSTIREKTYKDFMATATDQVYKNAVAQLYNNYKAMLTNPIAPDFSYQDVNGNQVTLNGLRGKYVLIDFWATWCEPCKKQFPFLAEIEKKYGEKMHFVGISIDKPGDKKKWETYVKSAQLGGIQLLADKGPNSDFVRKFNVSAVPRIMIIDPEGRIFSSDAKAPSDPQLAAQLEALLKGK